MEPFVVRAAKEDTEFLQLGEGEAAVDQDDFLFGAFEEHKTARVGVSLVEEVGALADDVIVGLVAVYLSDRTLFEGLRDLHEAALEAGHVVDAYGLWGLIASIGKVDGDCDKEEKGTGVKMYASMTGHMATWMRCLRHTSLCQTLFSTAEAADTHLGIQIEMMVAECYVLFHW
jgi:hypothetical protein